MTNEQKQTVQFALDWAKSHIQEIEAGPEDNYWKVDHMEWQLVLLLEDVVKALPPKMYAQAQACLDQHKRLREAIIADIDAQYSVPQDQQKTSPSSLPTAG